MTTVAKHPDEQSFTIYVKKEVGHLLSNPVFYSQNPPQVSKIAINLHNPNTSVNVACTTCINKDLQQKKQQEELKTKKKDSELVATNKKKIVEKEAKQVMSRKQKQVWFLKDLAEHVKLHEEQKTMEKQHSLQEDEKLLRIMKSEILVQDEKEKRSKRQRSISQMQLRDGLDTQLKEKKQQKQKQVIQNKDYKENPTCIPLRSCYQPRSSLRKSNYKLDLDQMIKERQQIKRDKSTEGIQKERERLLKVIEREQQQQKKQQRKKEQKRKEETEVMQQNIALTNNKKRQDLDRIHKQNQQPIKAFFDEQKRKRKQQQKQNRWKQELRSAMKQSSKQVDVSRQREESKGNRAFSSYRSRENSLAKNRSSECLKIVVNNDKVCCSKCHEVKPSYAVGNYMFDK